MVTRAEDVVINRDLERGDTGGRGFERTMTMTSIRTLNNEQKDDDDGSKKSDAIIIEETKLQLDPVPLTQDDCRNQYPPDGKHNQVREWVEGDQRVIEKNMGGPGDEVCHFFLPFPRFFICSHFFSRWK
jgi:hypothetical protein